MQSISGFVEALPTKVKRRPPPWQSMILARSNKSKAIAMPPSLNNKFRSFPKFHLSNNTSASQQPISPKQQHPNPLSSSRHLHESYPRHSGKQFRLAHHNGQDVKESAKKIQLCRFLRNSSQLFLLEPSFEFKGLGQSD